jgi:serine/threonine-protein kinase RsbW
MKSRTPFAARKMRNGAFRRHHAAGRAPRPHEPVPQPTPDEQAVFPARLAALPETAAFAQRFCERNGVPRDDTLRLRLVIEELFTNTVQHGYGVESDATIRISLSVSDGRVSVLYEDSAPRYDLLSPGPGSTENPDDPAAEGRVGGLGIRLVNALVAVDRYAYENGSNRLWLTLRGESSQSRT